MIEILILLTLLQIKHWLIDFVYQTDDMIQYKGLYGAGAGVEHSFWHGAATVMILMLFTPIEWAVILAFVDFIVHYHVDFLKMRYGEQDITNKKFWHHLGFDQMLHQLTYIGIIYALLIL
jgi:hypothetical protein